MRTTSQANVHEPIRSSSSLLSPPTSTQASSSSSPLPSPAHVKPMDFVEDGDGDEENLSDEASIEDPDEAQAALQPAISAAASHLTSAQTPAAEKAAALERTPTGGYFGGIVVGEDDDDNDQDVDGHARGDLGAKSANPTPRPPNETKTATTMDRRDSQVYSSRPPPHHHDRQQQQQQQQASPEQLPVMPTPWTVDDEASKPFIAGKDSPRTRQTKGLLESAFGPTRQRRSPSVGQEAFRRLQKAFPSFGGHTSFLPSLPTSFLSNLTGDHKQQPSSHTPSKRPRSMTLLPQSTATSSNLPTLAPVAGHSHASERLDQPSPLPNTMLTNPSAMSRPSRPRPPMLRRVTSDESMLYHSLSRQSSLGDDNKFHDVREMVNIRFMAIKDSLPDVPNFKMPRLARLHAASRMPSMSLNGFFSSASDDHSSSRQVPGVGRQTHGSSKPRVPAASKPSSATSAIDGVLEKLTGDLVILGGYRGSVLRSAEPPHQQLWAPVKLGFNMRKANLEVGLEDHDEETMEERITPSGMLKHVGPVDISRKLFKKLRASPNARQGTLRIWDFGYDWRLSPALSSKKLQKFLAELPSNLPGAAPESRGALVIAHSLGGLITRHAVNQAPELFAGILYAGVPQRCINILGPFRNGDAVLFNEKLLSAQVNFSIRTSFVLLPEDGFIFIDKKTGEPYPIDFFNADDWARWHLSPCVAPLLPPYSRDKQQGSVHSPRSSFFPYSLLKNKRSNDNDDQNNVAAAAAAAASAENQHAQHGAAPFPSPSQPPSPPSPPDTTAAEGAVAAAAAAATTSDRERYMKYLRRTLAATRKFRAELAHLPEHESANAYPPHAVLYGKTIPTVYAAQVASREAIAYADAYDDLVFRPGDGVVLAREAMLPDGYAIVRSGRVSTERGHLTMLGDLPAVAKALEALLWGRQKGIGTGKRDGAPSR